MVVRALLDGAFAIYVAGVVEHVRTSVTTLHSLPATALLLLSPLWIARILSDKTTWRLDLVLSLLCVDPLLQPLAWRSGLSLLGDSYAASSNSYIDFINGHWPIWISLAWVLFWEWHRAHTPNPEPDSPDPAAAPVIEAAEETYPIPPLILPARTTHTRLVPTRHAFSYSYLYVGVPVGFNGCAGSTLSADVELFPEPERRYGWFDVCARDYLARGGRAIGLEAKLREYLRGEGVRDKDWTFAYLVTAPRFLGYSFNPVSFWYVYKHEELAMMVLEVNNTFDERRLYLLRPGEDEEKRADGERFSKTWAKDFHVSPFNSTKGMYSLQAKDPRMSKDKTVEADVLQTAIDNSITLRSSKGETKLVARVFSDDEAVDPARLSKIGIVIILLSWWWVGLATFPRILYEAAQLHLKRKLHVWFRPEVLPGSIGRGATATERTLEAAFRRYLRALVASSATAVRLTYVPPGDVGEAQTWTSPSAALMDPHRLAKADHVQIKVLSPYFYGRFVHHAGTSEALAREGLCAEEKNRTVAVSGVEVLDELVRAEGERVESRGDAGVSWVEGLRWRMLRMMRCAPAGASYGGEKDTADKEKIDKGKVVKAKVDKAKVDKEKVDKAKDTGDKDTGTVRTWSDLDLFVRAEGSGKQAAASRKYRRTACKQFAAQRWAGGFVGAVEAGDVLLRAAVGAGAMVWAAGYGAIDVSLGPVEVAARAAPVVVAGAVVHAWDVIKG